MEAAERFLHRGACCKSTCYVPQFDLVSVLRYFQMKHHGVTDPKAVFSPISSYPGGDQTVQKLTEYRKTLLLAHKKAVSDKQEIEPPPLPASPLDMHSISYTTSVYSFGNASDSNTKLLPKFSGESTANEGFQTSLVQNMSKELPTRSEQENDDTSGSLL